MGPIKLKQRLLAFAKSGGNRTKLSPNHKARLYGYMRVKGQTYDINFCRKLYEIAPHWFLNQNEKDPGVSARKQHMLECAATGMTKATYFKTFGETGRHYLSESSNSYDPVFAAKIYELAPTWNIKKRVELKKEMLITYAKSGAELPKEQNNYIKVTLNNYTRTEYPCFDANFRKQVEAIRPEWFGA